VGKELGWKTRFAAAEMLQRLGCGLAMAAVGWTLSSQSHYQELVHSAVSKETASLLDPRPIFLDRHMGQQANV